MKNHPANLHTYSEGIGLAPMEGVSDFALRLLIALACPPDYMVTPFLRVSSTFPPSDPINWAPEIFCQLENVISYKLVPQLMGPCEQDIIRVGQQLLASGAPFVELNCGCPSPNVVGRGSGSSLLREVKTFASFVSTCTESLGPRQLAVKMRSGLDSTELFDELIASIAHLPLRRLTIHGRTKADGYGGYADWTLIESAARKLPFPVIGSGDLTDLHSLRLRISDTSAISGGLIGRGALRNPWVFKAISGQEVADISMDLLESFLACYSFLLEGLKTHPQRLYAACLDGVFESPLGTEQHLWHKMSSTLARELLQKSPEQVEISRFSLGRVKMLWNYIRSSLPAELFCTPALREKSLPKMMSVLRAYSEQTKLPSQTMKVMWQPEHDWLYAGKGIHQGV